jgi:transposase
LVGFGRKVRLMLLFETPHAATTTTSTAVFVRERGVKPLTARRQTRHGSGLGRDRWVVERTFAWLHNFKCLLVRYERRADMHHALLALGCCLVCFRRLRSSI